MNLYLISVCCYCGKEQGRKPLQESATKGLPDSLQCKDLLSHGICDECMKKVALPAKKK